MKDVANPKNTIRQKPSARHITGSDQRPAENPDSPRTSVFHEVVVALALTRRHHQQITPPCPQ